VAWPGLARPGPARPGLAVRCSGSALPPPLPGRVRPGGSSRGGGGRSGVRVRSFACPRRSSVLRGRLRNALSPRFRVGTGAAPALPLAAGLRGSAAAAVPGKGVRGGAAAGCWRRCRGGSVGTRLRAALTPRLCASAPGLAPPGPKGCSALRGRAGRRALWRTASGACRSS